jgi:polar amino acid transport system substrate-binding protein
MIKYALLSIFMMFFIFPAQAFAEEKESVYDRVMKSRTINCGYILYEPVVIKDPNTGEMSGIVVELMEEVARRTGMGFKIEWTVESSYGTFAEDIKRPNVDLMCATLWTMADTGLHGTSTVPLWYSGLGAFVRTDDNRFSDLSKLNDETITISGMDGSISNTVAEQDFPKAKLLSLPSMNDYSVQMMNVINKKADATFLEVNVVAEFMSNNPGTLKNLIPNDPMRVYSNSLLVKKGEQEMLNYMNMALTELMNDGFVDKLINKYEAFPGSLYRVAKPYAVAE